MNTSSGIESVATPVVAVLAPYVLLATLLVMAVYFTLTKAGRQKLASFAFALPDIAFVSVVIALLWAMVVWLVYALFFAAAAGVHAALG